MARKPKAAEPAAPVAIVPHREQFTITRRSGWEFLGEIRVEIECDPTASQAVKLGLALRAGIKAGANLAWADLAGANLAGANLAGADLAGADLARANLAGANLAGADLARAYLAWADLAGANLARANLARAYLAWADLAGANLAWADLAGAYLAWAKNCDLDSGKAPVQLLGLRWPVLISDTQMRIGCQVHPLADWAAFDDAAIAAMDGREALKFWRAHKDMLLGVAAATGRPFSAPKTETA